MKDKLPLVIILGSKLDLEHTDRKVTTEEGADRTKALQLKYNHDNTVEFQFMECSAKNKVNLIETIQELVRMKLRRKQLPPFAKKCTANR